MSRRQLSQPDISPKAQKVLMTISSLSKEERNQVKLLCEKLGTTKASRVSDENEDERFLIFYNILTGTLRDAFGSRCPYKVGMLPKRVERNVRNGWEAVEELCDHISPGAKRRTRMRLYQIIINTTIDYIDELGYAALSLKNVASHLPNCGAVMDKQFPGYMRAGLLRLVLEWGKAGATADKEDL